MPELPEVETIVRGLEQRLAGRRFREVTLNRADLRTPLPRGLKARLEGKRIKRVGRRAKYILIYCEGDSVLIAHLGMSGRIVISEANEKRPRQKHDHVIFRFDDGAVLAFNDARRFGMIDFVAAAELQNHKLLRHLGLEPMGPDFNGANLAKRLAGKNCSIKAALLDQRVIAGLGNIYASEALYWAKISPRRRAGTVQGARADALAVAIRETLERAIAAGGSSLRDYVQASGELGYFQHHWAVYGKEGEKCPKCVCHAGIKRIVQNARSTFYCANYQR
jgi:formamidopyrimidine-DNA glycosylase